MSVSEKAVLEEELMSHPHQNKLLHKPQKECTLQVCVCIRKNTTIWGSGGMFPRRILKLHVTS